MDPSLPSTGSNSAFLNHTPTKVADVKVVLLGESSVGKSSILQRFQSNSFSEGKAATIGAAFVSKKILKNEPDGSTSLINMQIWDTAGQERFHNLTPLYYRNANVALVVYDVADSHSFAKAEYWINELEEYQQEEHSPMQVLLVGNKVDLVKSCSFQKDVSKFLEQHSEVCESIQTSAKANIGIGELFNYIIDHVDESLFQSSQESEERQQGRIDLRFTGKAVGLGCQC